MTGGGEESRRQSLGRAIEDYNELLFIIQEGEKGFPVSCEISYLSG